MRLPRKVIIDGKEWTVKKDPKSNGGSGFNKNKTIIVGTEWEADTLENFLHEVLEIILTQSYMGYYNIHTRYENGDKIFVMNHTQFEKVCSDLALAIKDIVKEK